MKKKAAQEVLLIIIFLLACSPVSFSAVQDPHSPQGASSGHSNPLVEEMITLDKTFRDVVSAVALGEGETVHRALESMHGTMERTHKAVHAGTVKVPKHAHRTKEFIKLDKKFHRDLETLDRAARKNNQQKMLSLTKKLLDGCVDCHRTFKK